VRRLEKVAPHAQPSLAHPCGHPCLEEQDRPKAA
jgi:hypothetical protein